MKRLAMIFALGMTLAMTAVVPASAQTYGGDPPPPEDPPPSGCPVSDTPTQGDAPPCHPRTGATVSDDTVAPGQTITVTTPPAFAPGSEVTVNIVKVNPSDTADQLDTATANSSGAVNDASVTVPESASGIYYIFLVGLDADGNRIVAITPIVVEAPATASGGESASVEGASVEGDGFQAAAATPVPVPQQVADVQTELPGDAEANVVDAVTAGDAGLVLSPQGELNVRTPQGTQAAGTLAATGQDLTTQVTVGSALVLAGTGLVLLRRRKGALR